VTRNGFVITVLQGIILVIAESDREWFFYFCGKWQRIFKRKLKVKGHDFIITVEEN
jgi:hypothetical protein